VRAVEHLVDEVVEHAGYAGPQLSGAQHAVLEPVLLARRPRDARLGEPRPLAREREVQQAGEVDHVDADPVRSEAVEGRVDGESDQPHRPGGVDEDALGVEPTVGDAVLVGVLQRGGDLVGDPRRPARRQRPLGGDQVVERGAGSPLVDHPADAAVVLDVQHPEQPGVDDLGRGAGRVHQPDGPLVVGVDDVDGDRAREHLVVTAPEPAVPGLGHQVVEPVAPREDVTRTLDRHGPPQVSSPGRPDGHGRFAC